MGLSLALWVPGCQCYLTSIDPLSKIHDAGQDGGLRLFRLVTFRTIVAILCKRIGCAMAESGDALRFSISLSGGSVVAALPRELVSLVHNIELNRGKWWDKAVQGLITSAMLESRVPLSANGIVDYLRQRLRIEICESRLRSSLSALLTSGSIVELQQDLFKMSESALYELDRQLQEMDLLYGRVQNRFDRCLMELGINNTDGLWKAFDTECLFPIIFDQGARAYSFLTGKDHGWDKHDVVDTFVAKHGMGYESVLRSGMIAFLDPSDLDIRRYVLGNLRAAFAIKSANLTASEIALLARRMKVHPRLKIFVDTNVLFSILRLHQNPLDQSARYLISLTPKLVGAVTAHFYVLPTTLKEMEMTLTAMRGWLGDIRLTPSMSRVAAAQGIPGLPAKYVEVAQSATIPMSVGEFLSPYSRGLLPMLRELGLDIFNDAQIHQYGTIQKVIDDISEQLQYEQSKFGRDAKTYERLLHDIAMWHFTYDKRPARSIGSLLEAEYWIVTIDGRLLGFDSYKSRVTGNGVPVCVSPSTMISMLQFWAPRTEELDQAIISGLRPLFCESQGNEVESVSISILRALSRYEDVGDLSEETIANILTNESLRQRMGDSVDDEDNELIREAVFQECAKNQDELVQLKTELEAARTAVAEHERSLADRSTVATEPHEQLQAALDQLARSRREVESLQEENRQITDRAEALEIADQARKREALIRRSRFGYSCLVLLCFAVATVIHRARQGPADTVLCGEFAPCGFRAIALWIMVAYGLGIRDDAVSDWLPFRGVCRLRRCVVGVAAALACTALYDVIRWLMASSSK